MRGGGDLTEWGKGHMERESVITDCCYRWLLSVWLKLSSSIPSEGTRQWFLMMSFGKGASVPFGGKGMGTRFEDDCLLRERQRI